MDTIKIGTLKELDQLLRKHGLNPDLFGQGMAKLLESLFKEIQTGEAQLVVDNDKLIRRINLLLIGIVYRYGNKNLRLREDRQVFHDGRVRKRHDILGLSAISEKLKSNETPEAGLKRAIKEELGIWLGYYVIANGQSTEEKVSQSYPGLVTVSPTYWFEVELDLATYHSSGYTEKQDDKTTYWVWYEEN